MGSIAKQPAKYEKMLDEAVATEDVLPEWIFEKEKTEVMPIQKLA